MKIWNWTAKLHVMSADNNTIGTLFSQRMRDVTPSPLRSAARVMFLPICDSRDFVDQCHALLSPAERQRAQNYVVDVGRKQFVVRRAFRRVCASLALGPDWAPSKITFEETDAGQPFLPQSAHMRFSFSACAVGYLAAWSEQHDLGVDIEDPSRTIEPVALAKRYFSSCEIEHIENAGAATQRISFFQFWTLKEAALKSVGKGLAYGLDTFSFSLTPALAVDDAPADFGGSSRFNPFLISGTDGIAALVVRK